MNVGDSIDSNGVGVAIFGDIVVPASADGNVVVPASADGDAVAVGSLLHYELESVGQIKFNLKKQNIKVRI